MSDRGLGMVLSGGGTRCAAHLAVAKCLQEWNLSPNGYAGASGGALVAVLLALGKDPEAILLKARELSMLSLVKLQLDKRGLLDIGAALKVFTEDLPKTFEELPVPVSIAATNLGTGKGEIFTAGELLPPLLASCCMPVFFCPIQIGKQVYVDAGLVNNMPAKAIWGKYRYLLGVHTNPADPQFVGTSARAIMERTFLLTINNNVATQMAYCHRVLEPEVLMGTRVFDFKRIQEIYEKTYAWLRPKMPQLAEEILLKIS